MFKNIDYKDMIKTILLGILFAIVCMWITDAKADTENYLSVRYSDQLLSKIGTNRTRYENLVNYINQVKSFKFANSYYLLGGGSYFMTIDISTIDTDEWRITFFNNEPADRTTLGSIYRPSVPEYRISISNLPSFEYIFTFSDNSVLSYRGTWSQNRVNYLYLDSNVNPNDNVSTIEINDYYLCTDILSDDYSISDFYVGSNSSQFYIPLGVNGNIYNSAQINIKDFSEDLISGLSSWIKKDTLNGDTFNYTIRDTEIPSLPVMVGNPQIQLQFEILNRDIEVEALRYSLNDNGNNVSVLNNTCDYAEGYDKTVCSFTIEYTRENIEDITFTFKIDNYSGGVGNMFPNVDIYEHDMSYDYENNLVYLSTINPGYQWSRVNLFNEDVKGIAFFPYDYEAIDTTRPDINKFSIDPQSLGLSDNISYSYGYLEKKSNGKYIIDANSVFTNFDIHKEKETLFNFYFNYNPSEITKTKLPAFILINNDIVDSETRRLYIDYNSTLYRYIYIYQNENNEYYLDDNNVSVTDFDGNNQNISGSSEDTSILNIDLTPYTELFGLLPPGPIDGILMLPLSMLNSIRDALSDNSEPFSITLPFVNKELTLPTLNTFYESIGVETFVNWIGVLVSALMLLKYFMFLYNWLDNIMVFGRSKVQSWGDI